MADFKTLDWAWSHVGHLGPTEKLTLIAIAQEADSAGNCWMGQDWLAWRTGSGIRTVQRAVAKLRGLGLIHTERRPVEWERGRNVDVIVTHPEVSAGRMAYPGAVAMQKARELNRRRYETTPEPVENVESDQPANMAGRYVSPSQDHPANLAGRSFQAAKLAFQPANLAFQPAKCDIEPSGALIGSRARIDISQSVRARAACGKLSGQEETDGQSSEADSSTSPARIVRGVSLDQLRSRVGNLPEDVSDDLLAAVVEIVLDRASAPVKSPLAFVASSVRAEPELLVSQGRSWLAMTTPGESTPALAPGSPKRSERVCGLHNITFTQECPSCRADALAAPSRAVEDTSTDGQEFRKQIRRRRAANSERQS